MLIASAIQFNPRFARCHADVIDNSRKLQPLIEQAKNMGTNFLVLPELCLTGYSFLNSDEAMAVSEIQNGPTYRYMQKNAISLDSYISWGYIRIDPITKKLYNSSTMISPKGEIIVWYDKVNLFSTDFLWAVPGVGSAPIVQTEIGLLSVIICRDLRDKIPNNIPRISSSGPSMFEGKVDVVAACVNWGKGGFPSASWMDFVADNPCTLVVANRWGKEEGSNGYTQNFGHGGSCIIEPNWIVHTGGLEFNKNCVVSAIIGESI